MASRTRSNEYTDAAGTGAPSFPFGVDPGAQHEVFVTAGNGFGSTNAVIRRYTNTRINVGTAITYADSATLGGSFTINETGLYMMAVTDTFSGGSSQFGITRNSVATGGISTIAAGDIATTFLIMTGHSTANIPSTATVVAYLVAGDVIRMASNDASQDNTQEVRSNFRIVKVGSL